MLASKGLLWAGTNIGCIITLPLPRLEGVPQIKGRPCVSYHAHTGPIKFIAPIHCGVTQLQRTLGRPGLAISEDRSETSDDLNSIGQCSLDDPILNIMGVTETETDDYYYRGFTQSDQFDTIRSRGSNGEFDTDLVASLKRNKWISTPELRESQDDISALYGSLLRGTEYEEYDFDLMDINRKRPSSDMGRYNLRDSGRSSKVSRRDSKYNTLPIVMEDCPVYETVGRKKSIKVENSSLEPESPIQDESLNNSPRNSQHAAASLQPSKMSSHFHPPEEPVINPINFNSKSMVIVSGGEGHINWSEAMAGDTRYEDICLLLWQCKL